MKYQVRYVNTKDDSTNDIFFYAENDTHAIQKVIHKLVKHMDPVENIMCYPIKIKQNVKEIDLYPLPNSVAEGRDYIWRNQNLNFINIIKNLNTNTFVYPNMNC